MTTTWTRWLALVGALSAGASARADVQADDPYAYDLRFAVEPLAFQAGVSQSWFGSALRVEYAPARIFDLALDGRVAWLNANQVADVRAYQLRAGFSFHIAQSVREQELYGTVYPADTAAITGGTAADHPLDLPISEVMRTGSPAPYDRDLTLRGAMRNAHSLRLGTAYAQLVERTRPDVSGVTRNRLPVLHAGYAYATYWNLPASVTGRRELGYRRFYADVLLTTLSMTHAQPDRTGDGTRLEFQPLGIRMGMQGAMQGWVQKLPALGFAYDLELGLYPGRGGLEGYLFLALGAAIDVATR